MLVFGVGRVALIDPGRRFGKSTSRFLDVEDVSVAKKKKKITEITGAFLLSMVKGHVASAHSLHAFTSLNK